jgi:hypothetical protein
MRIRVSELSTFGVYVIAAMGILAGSERLNAQDPDAKPKRFIEPQLDRCTIVGDNHVLKPVKVISPSLDEYVAGNLRLTVDKSRIAAVHTSDNRVAWASQIPNGISLAWLGADEDTAYLLFILDKEMCHPLCHRDRQILCCSDVFAPTDVLEPTLLTDSFGCQFLVPGGIQEAWHVVESKQMPYKRSELVLWV